MIGHTKFCTTYHRKRQTGVMVTANDIILRDIGNNDQNQLQFSMFVQTNNGQNLLQVDTLQRAIQVNLSWNKINASSLLS